MEAEPSGRLWAKRGEMHSHGAQSRRTITSYGHEPRSRDSQRARV